MKFEIDGLVIEERPTGQEFYGEYVWPSGLYMCEFLKKNPEIVKGKTVLELGSGTGISGLYAAKLGAKHVTLTDFIDWNIENIKKNIKENKLGRKATPRWFKWGTNLDQNWDVIIGSDITYPSMDFPALMEAIKTHISPGGRCILVHNDRPGFNFGSEFKELESTKIENVQFFSKLVKKNSTIDTLRVIEMVVP